MLAILAITAALAATPAEPLADAFAAHTGARLVFDRHDLPGRAWHDLMPPLPAERRYEAARVALDAAGRYPPGFLAANGVDAVGIVASCASLLGDGYRPWVAELGGYRYYGVWNQQDAVAAAFYDEAQLAGTLHHEWFHAVDAAGGPLAFISDDARFVAAVDGRHPYPPAEISPSDLIALRARGSGERLPGATGPYAGKSAAEDEAETARWLQEHLADGLLQAASHPDWPGSQRLLHVLATYGAAGASVDWWVDVALDRQR